MSRTDLIDCILGDWNENPEMQSICLAIVGYIHSTDSATLRHITFSTLLRESNTQSYEAVLQAAGYLSGSVRLMDWRWEYINDETGRCEEVDLSTYNAAKIDPANFSSPFSGTLEPDFLEHVYPYFVGNISRETPDKAGESNE